MVYSNAGYPGGGCLFIPICQTGAYTIIHEFYPFFWENHPWGSGGSNANAFFMNWGASYGENVHDAFLDHDGDYNSYLANYTGYYLFTLVRCPYDRMISGYKFTPSLASQAFGTVCGNIPTRDVNFDENNRRNFPYRMAGKTQKKTLKNSSGTYLDFDYVMKYETIQQDWDNVCDALGRSRSNLDMKLSIWLDCAPVYSCDKKTYFPYTTYPGTIGTNRANISSSFSEDFKEFGYCIGNETLTTPTHLYQMENTADDYFTSGGIDLVSSNTGAYAYDTGVPVQSGGYAFVCDSDPYGTHSYNHIYESGTGGFNSDFNLSSFTFYLWFNCPDRSLNQALFSWNDENYSGGGVRLRLYNGKLRFITAAQGSEDVLTSDHRITNNDWHFVACIFEQSGTKSLYYNANKYSKSPSPSSVESGANAKLYIGKEDWGYNSNCKIDQVTIFGDTVLTSTQIRNHYNNGEGRYYV